MKVMISVVHKGGINTGAVAWASPSDSLTVNGQAMSAWTRWGVGEKSKLNLYPTFTSTGRDHEREYAPVSGPDKCPAVRD